MSIFGSFIREKKTRFDMEQLQQLEQLERLQQLQQLEITNLSYLNVNITTPIEKTVIYLDPPYMNTSSYEKKICYDMLKQYIKNSPYKIYLSSYESDFKCVLEIEHTSSFSSTKTKKVTEKLFTNKIK